MDDTTLHFNKLLDLINHKLNLDCRKYNESYIKRRINSRMIAFELGPNDFGSYIKILENNAEELRNLFDALTVNVTKFFRDIDLWNFLKNDVFPGIIKEKKEKGGKTIRIWSCGCSSGEEPYSIAILWKELLKNEPSLKPEITATDIDEPSLAKAKNGIYEINNIGEMPRDYLQKYFKKTGDTIYQADDSLKAMITFRRHNFFNEQPPVKDLDLIFCRNVIIYFNIDSKATLVNTFHSVLSDHSWLVLGDSEMLFVNHMKFKFYLYNEQKRIYRKERRHKQVKVDIERRKGWWYGYE